MSILALAACAQPGVGAQIPTSPPADDIARQVPIATATMPAVDAIGVPVEYATSVVEQIVAITSTATVAAASPPPTSNPIATASASAAPATIAPVLAPTPTPSPTATVALAVQTLQPVATAIAAPAPTATATLGPPTPTPIAPLPRMAQFVPLDNPAFVSAAGAPASVRDESFVLGLDWNGEARAYPLDMMWWHHIVNDTIGGDPVLVTY